MRVVKSVQFHFYEIRDPWLIDGKCVGNIRSSITLLLEYFIFLSSIIEYIIIIIILFCMFDMTNSTWIVEKHLGLYILVSVNRWVFFYDVRYPWKNQFSLKVYITF